MEFSESVKSSLQQKNPMFLQIGFVLVFLSMCMFLQPLKAQENITDTVVKVDLEKDTNYFFVIAEESHEFSEDTVSEGMSGTVLIGFTVNVDGSLTNFEIVKSSGYSVLDEEALRVVKLMPKWKPNKRRKAPVQFQIPITFSLD